MQILAQTVYPLWKSKTIRDYGHLHMWSCDFIPLPFRFCYDCFAGSNITVLDRVILKDLSASRPQMMYWTRSSTIRIALNQPGRASMEGRDSLGHSGQCALQMHSLCNWTHKSNIERNECAFLPFIIVSFVKQFRTEWTTCYRKGSRDFRKAK